MRQAVGYGLKRPFKCHNCGTMLEKDSIRFIAIMAASTGVTWFARHYGVDNPLTWVVFAAAGCGIVFDAYVFTKIKLSNAAGH